MSCLATEDQLSCQQCSLWTTRQNVVPGHGNVLAKIAAVAEAPGQQEDIEGLPLIGPAGRRFDRHLETAGLSRNDIFCTNVLLCRPPKNSLRDYPEAIIRCPGLWLYNSLAKLPNLRVVVLLGATAGNLWFPGRKAGDISTLARRVPEGYTLVGAMHPSYALRVGAWMNHVDESIVKSLLRARIIAEEG